MGQVDAARQLIIHGAQLDNAEVNSFTPHDWADYQGHEAMAAWLARIQAVGWARYLSEPRYKLVVLRTLAAQARAQRVRRRAFRGKELVLDFLFPCDQSPPKRTKQARRHQARLPDELFSIIAQYYWGGGLSADEEAAVAAEAAEAAAAAEESE